MNSIDILVLLLAIFLVFVAGYTFWQQKSNCADCSHCPSVCKQKKSVN